jgi:hypothetical protein
MRKFKLYAYLIAGILLIFLARLIFIITGRIGLIAEESNLLSQVEPHLQNLYILQAIVLFVPFIIIIWLIFIHLAEMNQQKKEALQKNMELEEQETAQIEEDTAEVLALKEQKLKEEIESKRQLLDQCFHEKFKNKKPSDHKKVSELLMGCLSKVYEITQAEIFLLTKEDEKEKLALSATYAFYVPEEKVYEFEIGEGLIGQVAKAGEPLYMDNLPQGYITVKSGLGESTPSHLVIIPWKNKENELFAVLEIASFKPFEKYDIEILEQLGEKTRDFYE